MGVKFRKSVKLGSGVRVNLSKRGVGISAGNKYIRATKRAGGGTYATFTAPGTGLSYRTKETYAKKSSSSAKRKYSSSNSYSKVTRSSSSSCYSVEGDPIIDCKRMIIKLKSELEHKEKKIESCKLSIILATILQVLLCTLIITIPLAFIYQMVKKKKRTDIELLELDVLELKIKIKRLEDELEDLIN